jgi:hypothetical protein
MGLKDDDLELQWVPRCIDKQNGQPAEKWYGVTYASLGEVQIRNNISKTQTIKVIFHEFVHMWDYLYYEGELTEGQTNKKAVEFMEEAGYHYEAFVERWNNFYRFDEYRY